MKKRSILLISMLVLGASLVFAHTPLLSCFDNGDGTITCEGGFSNGASAQGVEIRVEDVNGKVLIKDKLDKVGEFTFKTPDLDKFIIIFDAGPGHVVKVKSDDVE